MPNHLIVVYGPPLAGKSTLAWQIARSLPEKTAVVSVDQLLSGTIAVPDPDPLAELDMIQIQLRLLIASYLKNHYHVVVEGPFIYEREGRLLSFETDIDQLIALMRQLTDVALIVRLDADEAVLAWRAADTGREAELSTALAMRQAFRPRAGERFHAFDSAAMSIDSISEAVLEALSLGGFI